MSTVILALGYRSDDDRNAAMPKSRLPKQKSSHFCRRSLVGHCGFALRGRLDCPGHSTNVYEVCNETHNHVSCLVDRDACRSQRFRAAPCADEPQIPP